MLYEVITIADNVMAQVKGHRAFVYSELDLTYDSATMRIRVDRDKAAAYGITMQDIGTTLGTLMSDGSVNRVDLDGRSYEVIPQVERKYRLNPESLKRYYVRAADGHAVPLGNLVEVELLTELRALPKFNQLNAATISIMPIEPMGAAVQFFEDEVVPNLSYNFV